MPLSDGVMLVDGRLMHDNQEIAIVEGSYNPTKKDALDVNLSLQHTPFIYRKWIYSRSDSRAKGLCRWYPLQ